MLPSENIDPGKKLLIGLVGFGVVGKGLFDVLHATPGLQATIKKICIKHPEKKRSIDEKYFTADFDDLLQDDSINVIAELIDDADAAYTIVKASLQKGKHVVSANKKMIAAHLEELIFLQEKHKVALLYEASCCAGIPIIRNLEEYYDNDLLTQVKGIINGSTNFILTTIAEGHSFAGALETAQRSGFAESDPSLDTEGHDAANKLAILAAHAFGTVVPVHDILYTGITAVTERDALYAKEKNCRIKLVAYAAQKVSGELALLVLPQLVKSDDDLYNVKNEFNALETESCFADRHFFKGKGAGAYPTAAAVLSDIAALRYGYKYEYKKLSQSQGIRVTRDYFLNIILSTGNAAGIDESIFSKIRERRSEENHFTVRGVVRAAVLYDRTDWKQPGVSILLDKDPFAEKVIPEKISLAGFTMKDYMKQ